MKVNEIRGSSVIQCFSQWFCLDLDGLGLNLGCVIFSKLLMCLCFSFFIKGDFDSVYIK